MQQKNSLQMNLVLPCPAKLNLFLHITGQRQDGYHELQTVFQILDYCDSLGLTRTHEPQIYLRNSVPGIVDESNLVVRAARLLQKHTKSPFGARLGITKRIPMGGGLGGGSSNAASTLVGLNKLWETGLNKQELAALGVQLGADVPVFVHGHTAWAEGIGEQLQPLSLSERWFVVIIPPCHCSTGEVFSQRELTRNTAAITIAGFLEQGGRNDCEPVVRRLYPEVDKALQWLAQYTPAMLTGTGSCVFGSFETKASALAVLAQIPAELTGLVAKGLNVSPLLEAIPE